MIRCERCGRIPVLHRSSGLCNRCLRLFAAIWEMFYRQPATGQPFQTIYLEQATSGTISKAIIGNLQISVPMHNGATAWAVKQAVEAEQRAIIEQSKNLYIRKLEQ